MLKNKKYFSQLVVLLSMLFILSAPLVVAAEVVRLDFLTINDFHGALVEEGKTPGTAKLATIIKTLNKENTKGTIVFSAGDMFQGTVRSNILYGQPVMEMMNYLGFSAMTLGNHEFDWGVDAFRARRVEANFPIVSANITVRATGKKIDFADPYAIINKNGVKIGVIGITTPETAYTSSIKVVSQYNFEDPATIVKRHIPAVKAKGADIIVVLSHLGCVQDEDGMPTGEIREFVDNMGEDIEKISGIISGHTHTLVKTTYKGVPIVQALHSGRAVGRITMWYDTDIKAVTESKVDVVTITPADVIPDRKAAKIVDRSAKKARPIENSIIGNTEKGIDHDRYTVSPLGNWATDILKDTFKGDIAFMNGGGLRKPLFPGKVTMGTFYEIFPFDNTVITMELRGKTIKDILEYGLDNDLGTMQFAGIKVVHNKALAEGGKIVSIKTLDGKDLELDKYYTIVTNDFLADGGDGFVQFKSGKNIFNTNVVLREVFIDAVKATDNVTADENDDRYKILN